MGKSHGYPNKNPDKISCFEDFRLIALTCTTAGTWKLSSSGIKIGMFADDIVLWSSGTATPELELKTNGSH
ncbi:hypothetical protein TNCV_2105421 [Trichonephila clavipes]|nr:hypothetical protein TNCV_2105421 [Trichonephila clavipes]